MAFDLQGYLAARREHVNRALSDYLPPVEDDDSIHLHEAMRKSVLGGGKRLRPCLVIAAAEAVGGSIDAAMPAACAVEMVHCYSLVHDDLPAMDNDMLRRGLPTCHAEFGETTAILVGDALLTLAFEVLAKAGCRRPESAPSLLQASFELARGSGVVGMVGGQALDIALKERQPTFDELETCHRAKTAALFTASATMGGLVGGGSIDDVESLRRFGEALGLAFQHADDLRDNDFPNYRQRSLERTETLNGQAAETAAKFGKSGAALVALTQLVTERAREAMTHEVSTQD